MVFDALGEVDVGLVTKGECELDTPTRDFCRGEAKAEVGC